MGTSGNCREPPFSHWELTGNWRWSPSWIDAMMQALGTFCALCCLCLLHGVMSMENGDSAAAGVVVAGILTAVCAMAFRRRSVLRTTYYKESSTKSPITPSPKTNCARLIVPTCGRFVIIVHGSRLHRRLVRSIASRLMYYVLCFDHGLGIVHTTGLVVNCDMCHVH